MASLCATAAHDGRYAMRSSIHVYRPRAPRTRIRARASATFLAAAEPLAVCTRRARVSCCETWYGRATMSAILAELLPVFAMVCRVVPERR